MKLRDDILVRFNSASQRRIGHTLWASGLTSRRGPFAVYVGLVIFDPPPRAKPVNKMPLVGNVTPQQLADHATYPRMKLHTNWVHFRPGQYATEDFIQRFPSVYLDGDQDITLSAIRTGRTSGTTTGILLPDAHERALQNSDGEVFFVSEYVVAGRMGRNRTAFSRSGHSGSMSVIVDVDGQPLLPDLVTGGTGITNSTDKTFIYPWFAFNDLFKDLVQQKILPSGPNKWPMNMDLLTTLT